jgi:multisubunit Na+/H+ antiporter MnhF subunit
MLLSHVALGRGEPMLRRELGRWRLWMLLGGWAWFVAVLASVVVAWRGTELPAFMRDALPWAGAAIQLPGMACMLSGFHALLAITGRRSRAFSEAASARQSVRLLNGTAALLVVMTIAGLILETRVVQGPDLQMLVGITSRIAAACLAALLLFGAAYLVANAWWIARSLLLPPDRGDQTGDT